MHNLKTALENETHFSEILRYKRTTLSQPDNNKKELAELWTLAFGLGKTERKQKER